MKNKLTGELAVCGMNAVKAIERTGAERISRLYFNTERAPLFGGLCRALAANRTPYNCIPNEELAKLCGTLHHQGVVAMIRTPIVPVVDSDYINEWSDRGEKVLVLDNVGNANNFGAIVRSAAFFGWKYIVIEADRPYITTSAYRVAEGGMEYVDVVAAASIAGMLQSAQGKMFRIGASSRGKIPASRLGDLTKDRPAFLILGNEESGLTVEVEKQCDTIVTVFPGNRTRIESLNVAQAAAVLLNECRREKYVGPRHPHARSDL
ncbi:MAG: RNA methyltransferase [Spirochaetaceae bacterium]|nr:RNA methyltransferase [Spirochaetaceae bacterium]